MVEVISTSTCIREALEKLNRDCVSGHYKSFHKYIRLYELSIEHFQPWKGKRRTATKLAMKDILIKNSLYSAKNLKPRLVEEGYLTYECEICKLTTWQDKQISLQIDHINGDRLDNSLENLRFLCPNCHSQTSTYAGRNRKRSKPSEKHCQDCGKNILPKSKKCNMCNLTSQPTRIIWPPIDVVVEHVKTKGYEATGRLLGVSGNAIRKRLLKERIQDPRRSYYNDPNR